MKIIALIILTSLALSAALALPARPVAAAPAQEDALSVTFVSGMHDNGWTVTLSNGVTLFVEVRVFETHGRAPSIGPIQNFQDQGWFVISYYGYASFTQSSVTYHGYRS
jgi:hypothetical protein